MEIVGQWGGCNPAVTAEGNLAYAAVGPRVVILDISDGAHPVAVGRSQPLPRTICKLVIKSGLAYVADEDGGL
jgi:hypothetical protein